MQIFLTFSVLSASNCFAVQLHHRHTKSAAHATYCARAPADPRFGYRARHAETETRKNASGSGNGKRAKSGTSKETHNFFFFFFYKWAKNIYIYIHMCT